MKCGTSYDPKDEWPDERKEQHLPRRAAMIERVRLEYARAGDGSAYRSSRDTGDGTGEFERSTAAAGLRADKRCAPDDNG
jgi:hypothetical protein